MAYQITYTERFQKHYQTLTPQEKKLLRKKLELFSENPTYPSLRTKHIQGTDKLYECSVNMDIRIVWYYQGNAMIIIVDVGHHDILRHF